MPLGSSSERFLASFLQCVGHTAFRKPLSCSCRSTWGVLAVSASSGGKGRLFRSAAFLGARLGFQTENIEAATAPASSSSQQVPQPLPAVCHRSGSWPCACPPCPASSQLGLPGTGSWRAAGSRAVDMSHNGQKWEDGQEAAGGLEQSLWKKNDKNNVNNRARMGVLQHGFVSVYFFNCW